MDFNSGHKSRLVTLGAISLQGPVPDYCLDEIIVWMRLLSEIIGKRKRSAGLSSAQLVRATRASTTFPMCSLRLRSATAREISISDICNTNTGGRKATVGPVSVAFTVSGLNLDETFDLKQQESIQGLVANEQKLHIWASSLICAV